MFDFFKKKTAPVNTAEQVENAELDLDKEIMVHVMPEQFRKKTQNADQAKTMGLIILVGGFIFLLLLIGGFYYFITSSAEKEKLAAEKLRSENNVATTTNQPVVTDLAQNGPIASTTATTSPVFDFTNLDPNAATTTATSTDATEDATSTAPVVLVPAQDTDADGLTDDEETLLGSNINSIDSDGDSYTDFNEFNNLYDPTGSNKLADSQRIKKFHNETFKYDLFYPVSWTEKIMSGDSSVTFTSANNQFIQVNVQANVKKQEIIDWYKEQFNLGFVDPARVIEHKNAKGAVDWQGIRNDDGLTMYLTDMNHNNIIDISYNLGLGNTLNFINILNMVIKSFNITPN